MELPKNLYESLVESSSARIFLVEFFIKSLISFALKFMSESLTKSEVGAEFELIIA